MQFNPNLTTPAERNVTFPVEGREDGQGYLVQNDSKYGLIVIQEWWGLNQSMLNKTNVLAGQGFQALAPDMYRGQVAKDHEQAGHLYNGLDWDGAVKDIAGASQKLRQLGCTKVAVIGFCMGGALAIAAIASYPDLLDASIPFYGVCDLEKFSLEHIKGPIYGHFGEKDNYVSFSSPQDAERLVAAGQKFGKDVKIKVWPGVGHAFTNPDRDTYNHEISTQAIDEALNFVKETFNK